MNEIQMASMSDEIGKIKQAGIGSVLKGVGKFFKGGLEGAGQLASKSGRSGLWQQTKSLPGQMRESFRQGGLAGAGRTLAGSTPAQIAGVAAVPFAAGRLSKRDN
jgi:hypothetical protein